MEADRARELVGAERERIERALAEVERSHSLGEGAEANDEPQSSEPEDLYGKEFDEGYAEELRGQLRAVERAEERIADGSYGRSVQSGDPIPDARLEAVPTAERTIEEQSHYERGG